MEDRKLFVTLTGPAKIDGVREPAGKSVTVTTTLALQLAASGVINPDAVRDAAPVDLSDTPLESDFQEAVDRAVAQKAQVLAETMVNEAVSAVVNPLEQERDALKAEIAKFKGDLTDMTIRAETAEKTVSALSTDLATETQARSEAEQKLVDAEIALAKKAEQETDTGKGDDAKPAKITK